MSRMMSFIVLLSAWSAKVCKDATIAIPASIMVASWRVKTTMSCKVHRTGPSPALLAGSLVDGGDQQIASHEGGNGFLFSRGVDCVADFVRYRASRAVKAKVGMGDQSLVRSDGQNTAAKAPSKHREFA